MRETPLQTKRDGQEVLQVLERDSPATFGKDHAKAAVPLKGGGRRGPHSGAGGCVKEAVTLLEAHTVGGSLRPLE